MKISVNIDIVFFMVTKNMYHSFFKSTIIKRYMNRWYIKIVSFIKSIMNKKIKINGTEFNISLSVHF